MKNQEQLKCNKPKEYLDLHEIKLIYTNHLYYIIKFIYLQYNF